MPTPRTNALRIVRLALALTVALGAGCSDNTVTDEPPEPNPSIAADAVTLRAISDGVVRTLTPLDLFGAAADELGDAGLSFSVNDETRHDGVSPAPYYQNHTEAIVYGLTDIAEGDTLTILLTRADGSTARFRGEASADADQLATRIVDTEDFPLPGGVALYGTFDGEVVELGPEKISVSVDYDDANGSGAWEAGEEILFDVFTNSEMLEDGDLDINYHFSLIPHDGEILTAQVYDSVTDTITDTNINLITWGDKPGIPFKPSSVNLYFDAFSFDAGETVAGRLRIIFEDKYDRQGDLTIGFETVME